MRAFLLYVLVCPTLWANCPDLSGKYALCVSQTGNTPGSKDVQLTQRDVDGVTVYTMASATMDGKTIIDEMRTDGDFYTQKQKEPTMGTELIITKQYSCERDQLKVAMSVIFGEQIMMDTILLMKKDGETLTMDMEGTGSNGKPIFEKIICQ